MLCLKFNDGDVPGCSIVGGRWWYGKTVLLGMRLQEAADSSETVVTNYKGLLCGISEFDSLNLQSATTNVTFSSLFNDNFSKMKKM
jgi:hypothetical protein